MTDNLNLSAKADKKDHPVKYVLYSHYSKNEKDDFEAWKDGSGTAVEELKGIKYLKGHFPELRELLTTPGHEGQLVLYYAVGFQEYLDAEAHHDDSKKRIVSDTLMRFAREVAKNVRSSLNEAKLQDRVRFLISEDLQVILGHADTVIKEQFKDLLVGDEPGIRYDSPKIVEAFIRLRLLGNGIPVLRLDQDVIFAGDNAFIGDLGLFKAIECAVRAYRLRLEKPTVSTFMFSASYNFRPLLHSYSETEKDSFGAWSRAFATRIHPVIKANPLQLRILENRNQNLKDEDLTKMRNEYLESHLDEDLARQYYGLKDFKDKDLDALPADGTHGLTSIGAHPLYAVISGSLLCISEGAILDLPPFSNFRNNVMWIDDHLKYSLHRAMHHFKSSDTRDLEEGLNNARLDKVTVTKARPDINKLPDYTFGQYLPTLLLGTIMDAWITTKPILKCRYNELSDVDKKLYDEANKEQEKALLPEAMLDVLSTGNFSEREASRLREKLEDVAVARIKKVRSLWINLKKENDSETFASYWAKGIVAEEFEPEFFKKPHDEVWKGIVIGKKDSNEKPPIESLLDLNPAIKTRVDQLIKDAIKYVEWTLKWPTFVQMVRSIPQGNFMADLKWRPPKEALEDKD